MHTVVHKHAWTHLQMVCGYLPSTGCFVIDQRAGGFRRRDWIFHVLGAQILVCVHARACVLSVWMHADENGEEVCSLGVIVCEDCDAVDHNGVDLGRECSDENREFHFRLFLTSICV